MEMTNDVALLILGLLNIIDVIRAAAVSKTWRHFVIANGLCKKIFLKRFPLPDIAHITCEIEGTYETIELPDVDGADWADLERDHRVYSCLLQPLATPIYLSKDCLSYPISVSSTRIINENILATMNPQDEFAGNHLFWSSEGQVDPDVPEYIVYKLCSKMCIVTQVNIRPYKASSEPGNLVYTPTFVRFRFGYPRSLSDSGLYFSLVAQPTFDEYDWTYTSPKFPMTQEPGLQQFKLPEAIVCVGGVVQMELLGRAQKDPSDGMFYIRLGYVQLVGQSIHPAYVLDMLKNGELLIRFSSRVLDRILQEFRRDQKDLDEEAQFTQVSCPAYFW